MVVRQGGEKKAAANTTKKRVTKKKSTAEESRPTSTCISSPVRGATRKKSKGKSVARYLDEEAAVAYEDDESFDAYDAGHIDGYEDDGFVVADDDDDDDYFDPPPLRQKSRQRTLDTMTTTTTTSSSKLAAATEPVDEMQDLLIPDYMEEAKKLEEETRNSRSLRRPLFTEAQMRQMIINWTDSLDKMRMLPGVEADKVTKYGSRFIPLVHKYHEIYLSFHGANDDSMATIPGTAGPSSSTRRIPPLQPPGEIIELLSDEDEDGDDDGDNDANYNNPGVPSKYFGAKGQDDPLQAQLQGWEERFAATSQVDEPMSRARAASSSKKAYGGGKRNYYRRGGGGSRGGSRSYSGVSKSRTSASGAGTNRRTSGGGGGGGGAGRASSSSTTMGSKGAGAGRITIATMPY